MEEDNKKIQPVRIEGVWKYRYSPYESLSFSSKKYHKFKQPPSQEGSSEEPEKVLKDITFFWLLLISLSAGSSFGSYNLVRRLKGCATLALKRQIDNWKKESSFCRFF